jgi:hypothetical protein
MDVIGQIHRPDRENGVARQAHQQHPVRTHGEIAAASADANNRDPKAEAPWAWLTGGLARVAGEHPADRSPRSGQALALAQGKGGDPGLLGPSPC